MIARRVTVVVAKKPWQSEEIKIEGRCTLERRFNRRRGIQINVIDITAFASSISSLVIHLVIMKRYIFLAGTCCNLVEEVAWRTRSCTVAFFHDQQYECIQRGIDSDNPSINIPLTTYSSNTLWHPTALFSNDSAYSVDILFDSGVNCII